MPRYMCPAFGAMSTHRTTSGRISKQDHWQNAPMQATRQWIGRRDALLALVAVSIGLTLGYLDSRPSWDDTGISSGLLLLTSRHGRQPLRSPPLAVGAPDRHLDLRCSRSRASLAWRPLPALALSSIGAFGAYLLVRASSSRG